MYNPKFNYQPIPRVTIEGKRFYSTHAQSKFAVIVDKRHEVYLDGMHIDYVRQGLNEGFEFRNPNERDRSGYGESFRV